MPSGADQPASPAGSRFDLLVAPLTGLAALALYGATLAPGLTWGHNGADGGDLLAAALTGGVPHPTGYPAYQLLLRLAILVGPGDPARTGNWLSAICAAAAAACLTRVALSLLRRLAAGSSAPPAWPALGAAFAGLAWAISPSLWSQAVITEVYALNALFFAAVLWLLWRWSEAGGRAAAVATGLALGVGLGNHLSLGLLIPGAVLWLAPARSARRGWPYALAGLILGLAVYLYVPIAARAGAAVSWGDARTLSGFLWLVTGQVYRPLAFGVPLVALPGRIALWVAEALRQVGGGAWGALLALTGLWRIDRSIHPFWRFVVVTGLAFTVYAIGYNTPDSYVYLIPVWGLAALCASAGLTWTAGYALSHRPQLATAGRVTLALAAIVVVLPAISAARFWSENDLRTDDAARQFVTQTLSDAGQGALLLAERDERTFALWYAVYGQGLRPDVAVVNINLYAFDWYRGQLARRHPDLPLPPPGTPPILGDLLEPVTRGRPVYAVEDMAALRGRFAEQQEGILLRLRPK